MNSGSLQCCLLDNRINDVHLSFIAVDPAQTLNLSFAQPQGTSCAALGYASQGRDISVHRGPTSVTLVSSTVMGTEDLQAEKKILQVEVTSPPPQLIL